MPLSAYIKQVLNGLAYAHAGDFLSRAQKDAALAGMHQAPHANAAIPAAVAAGGNTGASPQIGLYLGAELPAELIRYVLRTCGRLQYGLTVLTLQTRKEAQVLLAPYQAELEEAGIAPQLVPLTSEPSRALVQALRQHPEINFLVCNESGYLGRSLLHGGQHILPIPVVLVSPNGATADADASIAEGQARRRAA